MTMMAEMLPDARVLDLFAGSGALGLEAMSRGAKSVDFVENGAAALHALKANVAAFRVRGRTRIFKRDAIPFVEQIDTMGYDVAMADPPYGSRKLDRIVERWLAVPFSAVLAFEHAPEHVIPTRGLSRRVGDSTVTLLRTPSRNRRSAS